jgi:hypothetical protein
LQELFQVNVFKGATNMLRSANPIGWASLQLRDICSKPLEKQEVELRWDDLTKLCGTQSMKCPMACVVL